MRRLLLALTTVAAATPTVAAVALALPAAFADTNTIANPGFESGNLSSWTCDAGDSAVTGHAHGGTYALAGVPSSSTTGQCTQTVSVAANTNYTLTGFVNGPYVYIGLSGGASTWTTSTSYSQLSVSFNSGSATAVTVFVHGWYGQGTYYADDFTM
jgi:chitinase